MFISDISSICEEEKVEVLCESSKSKKCEHKYLYKLKYAKANMRRNRGKFICHFCVYKLHKYEDYKEEEIIVYDDPFYAQFFINIDSLEKSYLLGWATNTIDTLSVDIKSNDICILDKLRNIFHPNVVLSADKDKQILYLYNIGDDPISHHIHTFLNATFNINEDISDMTSNMYLTFLRGIFESSSVIKCSEQPTCSITSDSYDVLDFIDRASKDIPHTYNRYTLSRIKWYGINAIDFIGKIYSNIKNELYSEKKYTQFRNLLNSSNLINIPNPVLKYVLVDKDSVPPIKTRESDSGYDIAIIKKIKTQDNVEFYDTGIKVQPSYGYYLELVPRSSISKTGYMLANNIGIIDASYTGNIIVALRKIDDSAKISLPCRIAQLIPRKIINLELKKVTELNPTERGEKGFGSTG